MSTVSIVLLIVTEKFELCLVVMMVILVFNKTVSVFSKERQQGKISI